MVDLDVAAQIRGANHAVVALESTVIAHGLPWPENLSLARRLEAAVREEGAVPATIAVLGGRMRVGLSDAELEHLARSPSVRKLTRRDVPIVELPVQGFTRHGGRSSTNLRTAWGLYAGALRLRRMLAEPTP